jgi:serpin B
MNSLFKGIVLVFVVALANCSPLAQCPKAQREVIQGAEEALADFAVNLFKKVTSQDENKNQAISPVSVALSLALLENGADGKTRHDIKQVLLKQQALSTDALAVYSALQEKLQIDSDQIKLHIANGLFQDKQFKLKDQFLQAVRDCFKGEVEQVDFQNQLEQTRQQVNRFVAEKTNQKIAELFKKQDLTKDDRVVLANAVYFKASWKTSFNKQQTKQDTFYRNGQEEDKQSVEFMQQSVELRHSESKDLDTLELQYSHPDFAMYVVLPKARDGLRDLEKRLTGKQLRDIISNLKQKQVKVQLPKFNVRATVDLKNVLSKMHLESLFSDSANFGRLGEGHLKVDSAVHEAFVTVDENGTEGAAATGVAVQTKAAPPRQETTFKADHPFLFAVVHKQSGAIVFLGKVNSVEHQE